MAEKETSRHSGTPNILADDPHPSAQSLAAGRVAPGWAVEHLLHQRFTMNPRAFVTLSSLRNKGEGSSARRTARAALLTMGPRGLAPELGHRAGAVLAHRGRETHMG